MMGLTFLSMPNYFTKLDRVLIMSSLVFSACMLLLMTKSKDENQLSQAIAIANLSSGEQTIKRKLSGSISWGLIPVGSEIFQGDTIFTEMGATANINFLKSGSSILVPPLSLIVIEEIGNQISLEIKEGRVDLSLQSNAGIDIKKGDKILKIKAKESSKVTVSNLAGDLSVSASKGSLIIADKEKKVEVKKDQVLKVAESIKLSEIEIISPKPGESFDFILDDIPVKFSRPLSGKILIAKETMFKNIIFSKEIDKIAELKIPMLPEGSYFFIIKTKSESSEIRPFSIINKSSFKPLSPLDGQTLILPNFQTPIELKWEAPPQNISTEIELTSFDHANVKQQTIYKLQKGESGLQIKNIFGDHLFWRGRTIVKGKSSSFSPLMRVPLKFSRAINLKDELKEVINTSLDTVIRWDRVNEKEFFKISFTSPEGKVTNYKSEKAEWNFKGLPKGKYRFNIESLLYPSKESFKERELTLVHPIILWGKNGLKYSSIDKGATIPINYKTFDSGAIDLIVTSNGSDETITLTNKVVLADFGKQCLKAKGKPELFLTDSTEFCFDYVALPPFGSLPKISDQILTYSTIEKESGHLIKVPSIERAVKYEFIIFADSAAKKEVLREVTSKNSYLWKYDGSGVYYFKYRVIDKEERSSDYSPLSKIVFPISPFSEI